MRSIIAASCLVLSAGCATSTKATFVRSADINIAKTTVSPTQKETRTERVTPLQSQSFAMVERQGEKLFMVISSDPGEEIVSGEPVLLSYKDGEAILKEQIKQAPKSVNGWVGSKVSLFGTGKQLCQASVADVYLRGNIFINDESFPFGQDVSEAPLSSGDFANRAWDSGRVLLVAELSNTRGCEGAVFGRLSSLPAPTLATQKEATVSLEDMAMKAFRALPEYKELQDEYLTSGFAAESASTLWENYEGAKTQVSLFETSNKKQMLSASVDIWYGCGDFEGRLFALWEVNADQLLRLITTSTQGITPEEMFDIEGDGSFEIIQGQQWYQLQNSNYQTAEILYIPWDVPVCPC